VLRSLALSAAGLGILLGALAFASWRLVPRAPSGTPPPPPTIQSARGALPGAPVGLQAWARYQGGDPKLVGCGFLFHAPDRTVVGATAAHNLSLGNLNVPLETIEFRMAGHNGTVLAFDTLHGPPGRPRLLGMDLTTDYVLLHADQDPHPNLVLDPDPRGGPQPGERVALYSGLGAVDGGVRVLEGSVISSDARGAWILMDDVFEPGMMSGSPVLSQHTGKLVGMALTAVRRQDGLLIGIHPVASLLQKADAALTFPLLADYGH
ncbi:MAG: hypothetical protein PVF70_13190, partial [Anaerolineales bacterium]